MLSEDRGLSKKKGNYLKDMQEERSESNKIPSLSCPKNCILQPI